MSTRSNVHFVGSYGVSANVYVHNDGYPEARIPDLYEFFSAVKAQTKDTRFTDASYLAAKFVVYKALQNNDKVTTFDPKTNALSENPDAWKSAPLAFHGV